MVVSHIQERLETLIASDKGIDEANTVYTSIWSQPERWKEVRADDRALSSMFCVHWLSAMLLAASSCENRFSAASGMHALILEVFETLLEVSL